ncbi:MAG: DNA cytosine methyltransferase [Proteobacteria bacterium]|nr:MAG: DNA cytosine methyltransferase [Pseudomonadota bacterium]
MIERPKVFDCFSGLGGLSIGADMAGMEVVGGVDADPDAVAVFKSVFPLAKTLHHDLLTENPSKILSKASIFRGDVDILMGGPPCQPYSINNHQRGTHDARCGLVKSYLGFVSYLQPEWIVMENVPGFASIEGGKFLKELIISLRARGYKSRHTILSATRFGVPQRRRRLIILAAKDDDALEKITSNLLTIDHRCISVEEAIGDLPHKITEADTYTKPAKNDFQKLMRKSASKEIQGHSCTNLGKTNLERVKHIPPGGNWRDIPRELLPAGMRRAKLSDHTTRYGRLVSNEPSYTLLTKCDPHWGCFIHPREDRVLTTREAARLQSIPDRVILPESLIASYRLIGNAVPPLLAKGILESILEHSRPTVIG